MSPRLVRGILFADYVRMIRRGWPQWGDQVSAPERAVLEQRIDPEAWYPLELFEQLGRRILEHIVGVETDSIRLWGRLQVQQILVFLPELAAADDPRESVMRFANYFATFFNFPALVLIAVDDTDALVALDFGMGDEAEEAASWQTLGFFEELLAASGACAVRVHLDTRRWKGAPLTRMLLSWESPRTRSPTPFLERPRVLLVDDEPLVARGLVRLIGPRAEVTVAPGAVEALRLLETRQFDTVLSDYDMPGRDGLSLLAEVARRWPTLRRVLHSGSMPAQGEAAVRDGVVVPVHGGSTWIARCDLC